jgi:hypothetical protein
MFPINDDMATTIVVFLSFLLRVALTWWMQFLTLSVCFVCLFVGVLLLLHFIFLSVTVYTLDFFFFFFFVRPHIFKHTNTQTNAYKHTQYGLVCWQRVENDEPLVATGCTGTPLPGRDYCITPPPGTLVVMGDANNDPTTMSAYPLANCQGDCDTDNDCAVCICISISLSNVL